MLNRNDKAKLLDRCASNYAKFGYSHHSLDWNKGKQDIRFYMLLTDVQPEGKTVIDVGCGFGDLLPFWRKKGGESYLGVDIAPEFINEAKILHANVSDSSFILADFSDDDFKHEADFVVASGTFNYRFDHTDNYQFIEGCLKKGFSLCKEAVIFNFLSDKVDWKYDNAWYSNPSFILDMCYGLSRNVILRNDYMPFEYTVAVFKDDSFEKSDTLFTRFKQINRGGFNDVCHSAI